MVQIHVQCDTVITQSIFYQILTIDTPQLTHEGQNNSHISTMEITIPKRIYLYIESGQGSRANSQSYEKWRRATAYPIFMYHSPVGYHFSATFVQFWGKGYHIEKSISPSCYQEHFMNFKVCKHSVESPSMVDPQWNIWYWGSKWNLHTVCWSEVGCEWGTTSVYFGITYVCFIPSRLPVFVVEPQYLLQYFLFLSKISFELHIQNLQKISCWFKIWMGFVGPILIKLWTSSIWGFL